MTSCDGCGANAAIPLQPSLASGERTRKITTIGFWEFGSVIPPTGVGGSFRSFLQEITSKDLCADCENEPCRVAVGAETFKFLVCRKDLNHPPTAVGGILVGELCLVCRKDLNHPPTAVGGILARVEWLLLERI